VSSLDGLTGIPCDNGFGTTQVVYAEGGGVTLTCTTPALTSSPNNNINLADATVLDLTPGATVTETGVNVGSSVHYYEFVQSGTSSFTFTVTGSGTPPGTDVFSIQNVVGNVYASDVSTYTATPTNLPAGTYYVAVTEATVACGACADGGFTLTATQTS
jgi:hypothetical protein